MCKIVYDLCVIYHTKGKCTVRLGPEEGKHRVGSSISASLGSRIEPLTGQVKGAGNLSYEDFVEAGVITDDLQLEGLNSKT